MEMAGSKQSTGGGRMRAAALPPKATINDNQEDRPHKKSCDQPRQNFEQNEKKIIEIYSYTPTADQLRRRRRWRRLRDCENKQIFAKQKQQQRQKLKEENMKFNKKKVK